MIPIPNLPTDSLYKFLFVGGIIMIISSFYFKTQYIQNSIIELQKIDLTISDLEIESIKSKNLANTLQTEFDAELTLYKKNLKNSNVNESKESIKKLNLVNEKLKEIILKSRIDSVKFNNIDGLLNPLKIRGYEIYSSTLYYSGIFIMIYGAFLWFFRIQIPQDKITKIQLELSQIELEKAKRTTSNLKYPKSSPVNFKR